MLIFTKFGIDHTNLDFCQQEDAVDSIKALRVVNDTAERGIHLIKHQAIQQHHEGRGAKTIFIENCSPNEKRCSSTHERCPRFVPISYLNSFSFYFTFNISLKYFISFFQRIHDFFHFQFKVSMCATPKYKATTSIFCVITFYMKRNQGTSDMRW